ncbi:MAG: type IV conjugative transfer system protein TraE, partial [Endomicrobium sp.]|nr:type IV conjugative transfer system protein TraE [Endomicrobium sp.]
MRKDFSDKKNDILIIQRNISIAIAIISFFTTFLLAICLLKKETNTVLVPSSLTNTISISSRVPHNTYLEAFSRDVIYTSLNLTPNNVEYAEKAILSMAHGSAYGTLKGQMELIKANIIAKRFSTAFYPIAIYPDNTTMAVITEGTLYTYLGQKEVSREKKRYE